MAGLWEKHGIPGGKFLVQRRDGSIPEWPSFVLGAKDLAAPDALRAYARRAGELGYDPCYVKDIYELADEFERYALVYGSGDPDAVPHRKDDQAIVEKMLTARNA